MAGDAGTSAPTKATPWRRVAAVASVATLLTAGCLTRRDGDSSPSVNDCAHCHGSADNPGSSLVQSAPPTDLAGNSGTQYPGVGAHAVHLRASSTHEAVPCTECHVVPEAVGDVGHADTEPPAELVFGDLATHDGSSPRYDFAARTCSDVYCHLSASPAWRKPRTSSEACGTCHGLPPPPPHVQSTQCAECHGEVVDARMQIIDAAKHVDGTLQVERAACNSCHGDVSSSGQWDDDGNAPPVAVDGSTAVSDRGVGAHAAHLAGGSNGRPLACSECHAVPREFDDPGHLDGLPADVRLQGVAEANGASPVYEADELTCVSSWCHSPYGPSGEPTVDASPRWTRSGGSLGCDACHSTPPVGSHPPVSQCGFCHAEVVGADHRTILDRALHVDGEVQVDVPDDCTACHGEEGEPAPPIDLDGNAAMTSPGVGAHRTHLAGTASSRALECDECHLVPAETSSPGHLDTPSPVEVTFRGVALSFGSTPQYDFDSASCTNLYCHGASYAGRDLGGSDTTPLWTSALGEPLACDSCHAMPPPAPHPADDACSSCHGNVDASGVITHPELHVDGDVTFRLDE